MCRWLVRLVSLVLTEVNTTSCTVPVRNNSALRRKFTLRYFDYNLMSHLIDDEACNEATIGLWGVHCVHWCRNVGRIGVPRGVQIPRKAGW